MQTFEGDLKPRLWDDPDRDYRRRYDLPTQFVWDEDSFPRIDFDSYTAIAVSLLPQPPARVLDVGCGPGLGSKRMIEQGYKITGIDYNERAIGFAKILVPEAEFMLGDVRLLAERSDLRGSFDAAVLIEVYEHIPPEFREGVIRGIRAMLSVGGVLVMTVPTPRMAPNRWDYARPDEKELNDLLRAAGFDRITAVYHHRLSRLYSRVVWRLIQNKYYDIKIARKFMRRYFNRRLQIASTRQAAGRVILRAVAV